MLRSKKVTKVDGSVDENSGLTQLVTSSKVSCLGRLTEPWAACRRVPKMQFTTTTLPTAFRAVPRRFRMTLTKTPRTLHPSGDSRGFRRQLLRRAEQMKRKRFRTRLPQRKQRQRMSLQRVSQPNRRRQNKRWTRRPQRREWLSLRRRSAHKHDDGAAGCTKGRWTISDWKKSKGMQDSWVMSVSKWFADENKDTGLQTDENKKFFGIASSTESFSDEGKELFSNPKRRMQRTPGSLVRSLECLQSDL